MKSSTKTLICAALIGACYIAYALWRQSQEKFVVSFPDVSLTVPLKWVNNGYGQKHGGSVDLSIPLDKLPLFVKEHQKAIVAKYDPKLGEDQHLILALRYGSNRAQSGRCDLTAERPIFPCHLGLQEMAKHDFPGFKGYKYFTVLDKYFAAFNKQTDYGFLVDVYISEQDGRIIVECPFERNDCSALLPVNIEAKGSRFTKFRIPISRNEIPRVREFWTQYQSVLQPFRDVALKSISSDATRFVSINGEANDVAVSPRVGVEK